MERDSLADIAAGVCKASEVCVQCLYIAERSEHTELMRTTRTAAAYSLFL